MAMASDLYGFGGNTNADPVAIGGKTTQGGIGSYDPIQGPAAKYGHNNPLFFFLVLALLLVGYLHFGFDVRVGKGK
jgi:hypothetical protein